MAVTIRDVAREAGVSVATVSHALTGYTDISVKTRQKIQETARRLGYQPNVNGRNLASKKSNRIALIIPDLLKRERKDNITFRMIQGVYGYCSSHGLEVAVYAHDAEKMTYRQFCESHAVEGILISDMITEDQRLQELMEIPVPFVAMHSECLAPEQRIGMDNAAAAADMDVILSILVDTFSSRILNPMLLPSGKRNIVILLSFDHWGKTSISGADPPVSHFYTHRGTNKL